MADVDNYLGDGTAICVLKVRFLFMGLVEYLFSSSMCKHAFFLEGSSGEKMLMYVVKFLVEFPTCHAYICWNL